MPFICLSRKNLTVKERHVYNVYVNIKTKLFTQTIIHGVMYEENLFF